MNDPEENGEECTTNPEWVPADYEVAIYKNVTTKDGAIIKVNACIKSKDSASGMKAHQALHDFLESL